MTRSPSSFSGSDVRKAVFLPNLARFAATLNCEPATSIRNSRARRILSKRGGESLSITSPRLTRSYRLGVCTGSLEESLYRRCSLRCHVTQITADRNEGEAKLDHPACVAQ